MNWDVFGSALAGSLGAGGVLLGVASLVGRKLIEHEFDKKLEIFRSQLRQEEAAQAADRDLFRQFLNTLPSEGNIRHIRDHSMGETIRDRECSDQLDDFRLTWDDPEHEFLDSELEVKRRHLQECIRNFLDRFCTSVFPLDTGNYYKVGPEWPEEQRCAAIEELDKLADRVVAAHGDLVRSARVRLNC